jgi:hypothetical protein
MTRQQLIFFDLETGGTKVAFDHRKQGIPAEKQLPPRTLGL